MVYQGQCLGKEGGSQEGPERQVELWCRPDKALANVAGCSGARVPIRADALFGLKQAGLYTPPLPSQSL